MPPIGSRWLQISSILLLLYVANTKKSNNFKRKGEKMKKLWKPLLKICLLVAMCFVYGYSIYVGTLV